MSAIAIVSPGWPDLPGGVTDHTSRLAAAWRATGVQVVGDPGGSPGALIDRLAGRGVRALLLQYVPFLYGRRGLSRTPRRLLRAARARGLRTTVFVHEPWVPPTRIPWLVLSPLQRSQLARLLGDADAVVTPVPAWRAALGPRTELLPVGSTLGPPPPGEGQDPLPAPVLFSPLAAGLAWDHVAAAAAAIGADPTLIVVGATREAARSHRHVAGWVRDDQDWRGRLPADAVLGTLQRARLVLAPFIDGLTGRRTSALAALSTGARVLSTDGPLTDPQFREGPVTLARGPEAFASAARALWDAPDGDAAREDRRAWYRDHLDPADLDRRLLAIVRGDA